MTVSTPMIAPVRPLKPCAIASTCSSGGQHEGAQRFEDETDQQERPPPSFFRMESHPRREDGDHDLRNDQQARHPQGRVLTERMRNIHANHRQHRSIGKLKQEHCRHEQNKLPIFGKVENARGRYGLLAVITFTFCVARSP
jgi:hypothetical protein